jgi:hypothetical protein
MADRGVQEELAKLQKQIASLAETVDRLAAGQKQDAKWRMIFRKQLASLVRAQYIRSGIADPGDINGRRFRLYSQNEEDGITLALLAATGVKDRRFVEIGCGGTGGNSAILALDFNWSGLMVDASTAAVKAASRVFGGKAGVTIVRRLVDAGSLDKLIARHGFAGEVDLLSIDVDSIDYWLLEGLSATTARVLVMEYNAHFGPERAVTVPNAPIPEGAPKGYSGASIAALASLAKAKGYRLVLCEDAGVNAFFVRTDLAPHVPTLTPAEAWRPLENKFDPSGQTQRHRDIYAEIEARGLPLVEVPV